MTTRILIAGDGALADLVYESLLADDDIDVQWQTALSGELPSRLDLALVLDDGWHPADYLRAEQVFRQRNVPWLRAFACFGSGFIGPLVRPGHVGCSQCADMRLLMSESDRRELTQLRTMFGAARSGIDRDVDFTRSGLLHMAEVVVMETKRFLQHGPRCSIVHDVVCTDLRTLETSRHFILPVAQCPVCGSRPDDGPDIAIIPLDASPKADQHSYRSASISAIGDKLVHDYLDARTGLMNDKVQDLITPFAAVSVNLPLMMGEEGTSGRSHTYKECEWIAILEGLERFCGIEPHGKRTVVCDAYNNLKDHALNPAAVGLHAPEVYNRPGFPFHVYDPDVAMNWVWGYSMTHQRPILVPERIAYYSVGFADGYVYETSNGAALGSTLVEAVFHGILEIVERDAFLMTWYAQLRLPAIDMASVGDRELHWMIERVRSAAGYDLRFYNATMENGVPTVFVIAKNRRQNGLNLLCSAGAHLDPMRAVKGAIQETAGMLLRFDEKLGAERDKYLRMLRDSDRVEQMGDHSMLYGLPEAQSRLGFLLDDDRPVQTLAEALRWEGGRLDLKDDLQDFIDTFARLGLEVIVVDQTSPELARNGLHCVKVLIPGMLPMTFGHHLRRLEGLNRVYQVPMQMGFVDRPLTQADLNPYPHPFP